MQLIRGRQWANGLCMWLIGLFLFFIVIVSVNHLFPLWNGLAFSSSLLGQAGWSAVCFLILYLARHFRGPAALTFLVFFCVGFWKGPFLEPPADPLEHLSRIHSYCEKTSGQMPRVNMGIWHYSMAGNLICTDSAQVNPADKLRRIDLSHGLFLGILMSGLFILAKSAGLKNRWAFFSCLVAFLFMGTNRFSYFSYYSLAPGSTSLLIYWLWTAVFFFHRSRQMALKAIAAALFCLPVLWVNHRQEAVFLVFLVIIYLLLNSIFSLVCRQGRKLEVDAVQGTDADRLQLFLKIIFFSVIVTILFVLPQFDFFSNFAAQYFVRDLWEKNQGAVVSWQGIHLWGKIWGLRVNDTLAGMGVVMAALAIPFFWPRLIRFPVERKVKIYILAMLPFLGYCIPLFHFIWLSNVRYAEYYRLCYSSMFWLLFAAIFQGLEGRLWLTAKKITKNNG